MNVLQPTAPQEYANRILIPVTIGWGAQLVLGGAALGRAWPLLFPDPSAVKGEVHRRTSSFSPIPFARPLLAAATLFNIFAIAVCWTELADFSVRQDRSYKILSSPRTIRSIAPMPIALTAAFTQAFMALRCWRLAERSKILGIIVIVLLLTAVTAGVTFSGLLLAHRSLADPVILALPQIFTWSSLALDTIITGVLVYHLARKKQDGLPRRAEYLLNSLIRLAFETCAIPWGVVTASAIVGAVAFKYPSYARPIYWALCAVTPSLYILSFTYCLEATMHRMASPPTPRPSPKIPRSPIQPTRQCLCAYVRPFADVEAAQSIPNQQLSSSSDGTKSWEAPRSWESSKEHDIIPVRGEWQTFPEPARPPHAYRRTNHIQTLPALPYS